MDSPSSYIACSLTFYAMDDAYGVPIPEAAVPPEGHYSGGIYEAASHELIDPHSIIKLHSDMQPYH